MTDLDLLASFLPWGAAPATMAALGVAAYAWRGRREAMARAVRLVTDNEDRLRTALSATGQAMYELDLETGATRVSPEYASMLGYEPDTFRESMEQWRARVHPDDRNLVVSAFAEYATGTRSEDKLEFRLRTASGDWKWILSRGSVVDTGVAGAPRLLIGTYTDITDRKLAEARLLEREERFRRQRDALVALAAGNTADNEPLESALRRITELDARTLGVSRVSIWRYSPDCDGLECVDLYELDEDRHSSGFLLRRSEYPLYFEALTASNVIAASDAHNDRRTSEFSASYLGPLRIASMLDATIHVSGVVGGVVCHEHIGEQRIWTEDEKTFGVAIANLVSLALEGAERRRTEEELRTQKDLLHRAHQLLSSHLSNSPLAVIEWDRDFRVSRWSDAATRIFGWNADEVMNKRPDEWPFIHESEASAVEFLMEELLAGRPRNHSTTRNYSRSGAVIYCEWYNSAVTDDAGEIVSILSLVHDISERIRADSELRLQGTALSAAADAIVITDRNGFIAWVNPAFTTITGYSPGQAIGADLFELVTAASDAEKMRTQLWATLLAGDIWRGELLHRRPDGSTYPAEQTLTPVRGADGRITHVTAILRDLTVQHDLEARYLQAQKLETVGRLAGGIAHDFNNLLTVINGTADLAVIRLAAGDPLRADLEHIRDAGERAASLTRQLLAFSRKQILRADVLCLNNLIPKVKGMLQRLIGEDIELRMSLGKVGHVRADAGQMEQVLLNLAVNARDAMPEGGTITITTRLVELRDGDPALSANLQPGPHVLLTVADTGSGMDETTRLQIFDPFFTTKDPEKGTGLGLAMVHGIVNQSGGAIWVDSQAGRGSTFTICLPQVDAPAPEVPAPRRTVPVSGTGTILVVEDEDALRLLAERILKRAGYEVLSAANGAAALDVLQACGGAVDLMLTDVVMPGMSGRDLATRVATLHPDMKVLFTSGYTDDAILRHGVLDHAAHFLAKPYTIESLTGRIREMLDTPAVPPGLLHDDSLSRVSGPAAPAATDPHPATAGPANRGTPEARSLRPE